MRLKKFYFDDRPKTPSAETRIARAAMRFRTAIREWVKSENVSKEKDVSKAYVKQDATEARLFRLIDSLTPAERKRIGGGK